MQCKIFLVYLFILPLLHMFLLELFASMEYMVYFIVLLFSMFLLTKYKQIISFAYFKYYLMYLLFLYGFIILIQDRLYDYSLDFGMNFIHIFPSLEVVSILSLAHLLILYLLGYNSFRKI